MGSEGKGRAKAAPSPPVWVARGLFPAEGRGGMEAEGAQGCGGQLCPGEAFQGAQSGEARAGPLGHQQFWAEEEEEAAMAVSGLGAVRRLRGDSGVVGRLSNSEVKCAHSCLVRPGPPLTPQGLGTQLRGFPPSVRRAPRKDSPAYLPLRTAAHLPLPLRPSQPEPVHPLHGQPSFLACTPLCTWLCRYAPGGCRGPPQRAVLRAGSKSQLPHLCDLEQVA